MATKTITIEASKQKHYFEVDDYNGKYLLYRISYGGGFFGDRKNRGKIGETKTFEDAVALAKVSVNGNIGDINID
jgi:hypothetical protein